MLDGSGLVFFSFRHAGFVGEALLGALVSIVFGDGLLVLI